MLRSPVALNLLANTRVASDANVVVAAPESGMHDLRAELEGGTISEQPQIDACAARRIVATPDDVQVE